MPTDASGGRIEPVEKVERPVVSLFTIQEKWFPIFQRTGHSLSIPGDRLLRNLARSVAIEFLLSIGSSPFKPPVAVLPTRER